MVSTVWVPCAPIRHYPRYSHPLLFSTISFRGTPSNWPIFIGVESVPSFVVCLESMVFCNYDKSGVCRKKPCTCIHLEEPWTKLQLISTLAILMLFYGTQVCNPSFHYNMIKESQTKKMGERNHLGLDTFKKEGYYFVLKTLYMNNARTHVLTLLDGGLPITLRLSCLSSKTLYFSQITLYQACKKQVIFILHNVCIAYLDTWVI